MSQDESRAKRLRSRNRKKSESQATAYSHEVIAIERNKIEQFLLTVKHWAMTHQHHFRLGLFSLAAVIGFIVILIIINALAAGAQNAAFYDLQTEFDKASKSPEGDDKNKKLSEVLTHSMNLCNRFWLTDAGAQGCMIAAETDLKLHQYVNAADYFLKHASHFQGKAPEAYSLFYAGYSYEAGGDLTKAYDIYDKMQDVYKSAVKEDIAIYHKARIAYLQKKFSLARDLFTKLIVKYKTSTYLSDARQYLLLMTSLAQPSSDKTPVSGK